MVIPYGRQDITQADIDAVTRVLQSDMLTQGPEVPRFESLVAQRCGAHFAVASNSATSSLHLACLALGLGAGDILWTSAITFAASANCGLYCGAEVDFVDIDLRTFNMSAVRLAEKLDAAAAAGRLPKVLVVVHMCGQPSDMQAINELARRHGVAIIEDASHAIGARYLDEPVGNCRFSDITVFSFHPVKIITTAEGGLATTNNADLASAMALLRSHGITREPSRLHEPMHGPWYYEQIALGFNYRMTEVQAALGSSQLDRLDAYVAERHRLAERYDSILSDLPITLPLRHPDRYSAFHLYVIRIDGASREQHRAVHELMRAAGILVNLHYIPVPMLPWYQQMGHDAANWPEACRYYGEAMTLPLYATMSDAQQDEVLQVLKESLESVLGR